MSVVIDASIIIAAVIPSEVSHHVANQALTVWSSTGTTLIAPPLLYAEVTAVLRKLSSTGRLTQMQAEQLLETICALPIEIIHDIAVYETALKLAHLTTLCVRTTHNTSLSLNVWKQFFGPLIENLHTQCFFRTFATLMILKCRNMPG